MPVRGSEEFRPEWRAVPGQAGVYEAPLDPVRFGAFNPFPMDVNYAPLQGVPRTVAPKRARPAEATAPLPLTRGQVFMDGRLPVQGDSLGQVHRLPGSRMVNAAGGRLVEVAARERVFAPLRRGPGYITIPPRRWAW